VTTIPAGLDRWRSEPGGAGWLARLPDLVEEAARRFGVRVLEAFEPATTSFVAPVEFPDGREAVLKVNFPDRESEGEADALAWWDGHGAVRLLASAHDLRALLVDRCRPGRQLWSVSDDDTATRLAADVLRKLWRPVTDALPVRTLAEEAEIWSRHVSLPPHWRALARSQPELVVCHQDLHGGNVLADREHGWVAIDPKPLAGERAFDVASLIRDRREGLTREIVRRRMDILVEELDLDRERVRGWAIVHALAWGHPHAAEMVAAA
jgi:streptomycin 6-kinase